MSYQFYKLHGCGNDFIFIDSMDTQAPPISPHEVRAICDRNFGVGADAVIFLERGRNTDARWNFYNSDGSEAEMCGNAARCAILFLADKYFPGYEVISLETPAGTIKGKTMLNGLVEVMLAPSPHFEFNYEEKLIHSDEGVLRLYCVNTGVPHAVMEVPDIRAYPISRIGKFLVRHPAFGVLGTNVTFFQRIIENEILSTTFERGVDRETFACGTGVAAAAVIYSQLYLQSFPLRIKVPGGELEVDMSPYSKVLLLRGPAEYVMEGTMYPLPEKYEAHTLFDGGS